MTVRVIPKGLLGPGWKKKATLLLDKADVIVVKMRQLEITENGWELRPKLGSSRERVLSQQS